MDLGWGLNTQWGYGPYVYLYNYNHNLNQQLVYTTAAQLQSAANANWYLSNDNGDLAVYYILDTFVIRSLGAGYALFDTTAALYVISPYQIGPFNYLTFTSTPTVWTAVPQ